MHITPINLKNFIKVRRLYLSAFTENERFPFSLLLLYSAKNGVRFHACEEGGKFCGLTYTLETDKVLYLLYLAVSPDVRSKGLGSAILSEIKKEAGNREIILNVEPPDPSAANAAQRTRRIAFYERNRFTLTPYHFYVDDDEYRTLSSHPVLNLSAFEEWMAAFHFGGEKPGIGR